MPRHLLQPTGHFPSAGLPRRLGALFYDFLLCLALMIITTLLYQQGLLRAIYGGEQLLAMSRAGALDRDPVLWSVLLLVTFGFFARFWTGNGQTLGMQVWGMRVQNVDGRAISLSQALLRYMVGIPSWALCGLGYFWCLWDKQGRSWCDIYSESLLVQLPRNAYRK